MDDSFTEKCLFVGAYLEGIAEKKEYCSEEIVLNLQHHLYNNCIFFLSFHPRKRKESVTQKISE